MSGFAHADGGVLIWGIKSKTVDGVDTPDRLLPILNAGDFCARLRSSIIETTQPIVDGILMEVINSSDGSADSPSGFIKCLIPASDRPPHRAMNHGLYWRRTTHGQRQMEHYELEDMFGRRMRPVLVAHVQLVPDSQAPSPREILKLSLDNQGRGVAKYASVFLRLLGNTVKIVNTHGLQDVTRLNNTPCFSWGLDHSVIHPGGVRLSIGSVSHH